MVDVGCVLAVTSAPPPTIAISTPPSSLRGLFSSQCVSRHCDFDRLHATEALETTRPAFVHGNYHMSLRDAPQLDSAPALTPPDTRDALRYISDAART
jgi:hypothetical protein